MHSLPRKDEEKINNMIRKYKECKVVYVDNLELGYKVHYTEFKIQGKKKEIYNRATKKEEDRKLAEDYLDR